MMTFFGAQYDSDASPAVTSPAGESYESEEHSSDGDAPADPCVDLCTVLILQVVKSVQNKKSNFLASG